MLQALKIKLRNIHFLSMTKDDIKRKITNIWSCRLAYLLCVHKRYFKVNTKATWEDYLMHVLLLIHRYHIAYVHMLLKLINRWQAIVTELQSKQEKNLP